MRLGRSDSVTIARLAVNHMPGSYITDEEAVWRLYQGERPVGFGKRFGSSMMWSRTGAAYSGQEIQHTVQVRALPLRTPSGTPIFHGDVVSPRREEGERYLVLGVGEDLLFAKPRSSRFVRRDRSDFARRREFIRHGNVLESVHFSRTFDAALRAYAARGFASGALSWALSAATFAACVLAALLQWGIQGGVGPILSCLGGILVGWGFFFGWRQLSPESFRRGTTTRVASGSLWRTALLFSGSYGVAGAMGLPGVATSVGGVVAGMFAAAVFGFFFAIVAGGLAADTLTRNDDRKLGLPSEVRSFIDTPSPLLRVRQEELAAFAED